MPLGQFFGNVDVVSAYEGQKSLNEQRAAQQLQQYSALQKLIMAKQESADTKQFRAESLRMKEKELATGAETREADRAQRLKELQMRGEQEMARINKAHELKLISDAEAAKRTESVKTNLLKLEASLRPTVGEPLVSTLGPDGKPVLTPRSKAAGMSPAPPAATAVPGLTPENAGKVAMERQSREAIKTVRGIIFRPDGGLDRTILGAMGLPVVAGLPLNSKARIARSAIRNAIEAKLRLETGAAATEPEIVRTTQRFMPTIADTPESAKFKLDELDKFFASALSMTKGIPEGTKAEPASANEIDFGALK